MTVDRYGLPVTTESAEALERYQDGMDRLLSYGPDAEERFAAATAADEGLALAHAGTALLAFFQGEGDAARAAIGRAARLVSGASRRERQHVEALSTMIGGDTARGLALIEEHVGDFPRDALLVNHANGHPIAGTVALPLVRGIAAFAAGDLASALAHFEPVEGEIHRMGGSHAQWELFEETMVVCYLKLGQHDRAARLLHRRLGRRPSAQDRAWLARVDAPGAPAPAGG